MLDIVFVLIVITALLVVVGLCQPVAAYLKLPPPVLLGLVGLSLGGLPVLAAHLDWSRETDAFAKVLVDLPVSSGTFIYVFLPVLVFEAGIATDVRRMLQDAALDDSSRCIHQPNAGAVTPFVPAPAMAICKRFQERLLRDMAMTVKMLP